MKKYRKINQCPSCGWTPSKNQEELPRDHCPNCLCGIHHETGDGLECGGILELVSVWVKENGHWEVIQRCQLCGKMETAEMTKEDSTIKVLSIIAKPLAMPPFPIERLEDLARMMGGQGDLGKRGGDRNEP